MVFDFIEPVASGWLNGDSSLPESFPVPLTDAFLTLYFTDEGEWVRVVEATILSVSRVAVPLPSSLWLVLLSLFLIGGRVTGVNAPRRFGDS